MSEKKYAMLIHNNITGKYDFYWIDSLNNVLDALSKSKKFRKPILIWQKHALEFNQAVKAMLKKGYLIREGTEDEFQIEDDKWNAIENFARELSKHFPEEWKKIVAWKKLKQ